MDGCDGGRHRYSEAASIYENLSVYDAVHMDFDPTGVDEDQAQELVETYEKR